MAEKATDRASAVENKLGAFSAFHVGNTGPGSGWRVVRWLALVVLLGMLPLALLTVARAQVLDDSGSVQLSHNAIAPGGADPIVVAGSDYRGCASATVTISLLFPRPYERGYSLEGATEYSPVEVQLDASGNFRAELQVPPDFPGNWHGLIAMRGSCVLVTSQTRYLASLPVIVPVDSPKARELGIASSPGALIIPAPEIQRFPVLPPDDGVSPYEAIGPFSAVEVGTGRVCASADPADSANLTPAGDLRLPFDADDPACSNSEARFQLRSGTAGVLLLEEATYRPGWVTPIRLTWPPPDTGAATGTPTPTRPAAPGAPATGARPAPIEHGGHFPASWLAAGLGLLLVALPIGLRARRAPR